MLLEIIELLTPHDRLHAKGDICLKPGQGAGRWELASGLEKIEHYFNRAQELRVLAHTMRNAESRELLRKTADEFEAMAKALQKRQRER